MNYSCKENDEWLFDPNSGFLANKLFILYIAGFFLIKRKSSDQSYRINKLCINDPKKGINFI